MMHKNNRKAIENFTPKQLAELYRDYQNNWMFIKSWYSSFMPEEEPSDAWAYDFYHVCEKFHEMGF